MFPGSAVLVVETRVCCVSVIYCRLQYCVSVDPLQTAMLCLLGTGAQDGHLDFHTVPELWHPKGLIHNTAVWLILYGKTTNNTSAYCRSRLQESSQMLKQILFLWQIEISKSAILSCSRYLARVVYKLGLNSWNTEYSQNVTCICKNILSVKHILLECPITTELFQKNKYDLNAYDNVRDILHNTDGITVKLIVHSPVGKLV